jgi:hypothetical protein
VLNFAPLWSFLSTKKFQKILPTRVIAINPAAFNSTADNMESRKRLLPRNSLRVLLIEAPCSKLQGIFGRKECGLLLIRSLIPPIAAGNALACAVQVDRECSVGVWLR